MAGFLRYIEIRHSFNVTIIVLYESARINCKMFGLARRDQPLIQYTMRTKMSSIACKSRVPITQPEYREKAMGLEKTLNTDATELTLSYRMRVFQYGLTKALIGELGQHLNANLQDSSLRVEVIEWHDASITNNIVIPPLAVLIRLSPCHSHVRIRIPEMYQRMLKKRRCSSSMQLLL